MAFAKQKVGEVATIARGLGQGREAIADELDANDRALEDRRNSHRTRNPAVRDRVAALTDKDATRQSPFEVRREAQAARLALPLFPTTTIGSYPQTAEIRQARAELRQGEIDHAEYLRRIRSEVERVIRFQEDVASTFSSTASPSATTWSSTSPSRWRATSSPRTPGCSPTARAMCARRSSSETSVARTR